MIADILLAAMVALSHGGSPVDGAMAAMAATIHGVDQRVMRCVVSRESEWDRTALGALGERGLMQILPTTGAFLADHAGVAPVDLWDPWQNLYLGAYGLAHYPEWWSTYPLCINVCMDKGARE